MTNYTVFAHIILFYRSLLLFLWSVCLFVCVCVCVCVCCKSDISASFLYRNQSFGFLFNNLTPRSRSGTLPYARTHTYIEERIPWCTGTLPYRFSILAMKHSAADLSDQRGLLSGRRGPQCQVSLWLTRTHTHTHTVGSLFSDVQGCRWAVVSTVFRQQMNYSGQ